MSDSQIPYARATSGGAARDQIAKLLRRMGCDSVGFMDEFARKSVRLAFVHQGRAIQFEAFLGG